LQVKVTPGNEETFTETVFELFPPGPVQAKVKLCNCWVAKLPVDRLSDKGVMEPVQLGLAGLAEAKQVDETGVTVHIKVAD